MYTDVLRWEVNIQTFMDLLISKNGIPGTIRTKEDKQFVEFHLCSEDLLYKDEFHLPRNSAVGTFFISLDNLMQKVYNKNIEYTLYGKPSKKMFDYASKIT
jgi:hypothetical protein